MSSSRIAWVTGGGTGIGRALAEALYREGYVVAISGRRKEVLVKAAQEIMASAKQERVRPLVDVGSDPISGSGAGIWVLPGDVSDPSYVEEAVHSIRQKWGNVELLINNAGVNTYHSFKETNPAEFEQLFRINCLSAVLCAKAVLPAMLAMHRGDIVNISSILGKWASADSAAYTVSKFALAGLTDVLRQELVGTAVHVMGVYPGLITTPMTERFVRKGTVPKGSVGTVPKLFQSSPQAMAKAILRGAKRKQREVLFPWYVPWAVRLYQRVPRLLEKLRAVFDH